MSNFVLFSRERIELYVRQNNGINGPMVGAVLNPLYAALDTVLLFYIATKRELSATLSAAFDK